MAKFGNTLQMPERAATPSGNPPSGAYLLYFKSDGLLYRKNSAGVEAAVGGGGGGGSSSAEYNLTQDWSTTKPTSPSTGITIFARHKARRLLAMVGPQGLDTALQPGLFTNRVCRMTVTNNIGVPVTDGLAVTSVTTPTAVPVAATNFYTSLTRSRWSTSTAVGNANSVRSSTAQWHLSNTASKGGFFFVARFGLNAITATNRVFCGMSTTATALAGTVDPSTLLSMFGFACNSAHTNFRFMHNDASGAATQVDLGVNFPTNAGATWFYEARLFAPSGGGQNVFYSLERLNDGQLAQGSVTTDLPALDTLMAFHILHSNGTTAAIASMDIQSAYIETDN